jgi:hypothetical protein
MMMNYNRLLIISRDVLFRFSNIKSSSFSSSSSPPFSLSSFPLFLPPFPSFFLPHSMKKLPAYEQFCAVGMSIGVYRLSTLFSAFPRRRGSREMCLSEAVDLTDKKGGAHAWIMGGRTRGSTDRRTPLLDNLLLTPVPPLHDELAIHCLLRSNSSSVANAVLFFTRNNIVTFLIFTNNNE